MFFLSNLLGIFCLKQFVFMFHSFFGFLDYNSTNCSNMFQSANTKNKRLQTTRLHLDPVIRLGSVMVLTSKSDKNYQSHIRETKRTIQQWLVVVVVVFKNHRVRWREHRSIHWKKSIQYMFFSSTVVLALVFLVFLGLLLILIVVVIVSFQHPNIPPISPCYQLPSVSQFSCSCSFFVSLFCFLSATSPNLQPPTYRHPLSLILDEPTAAMDAEAEAAIFERLASLTEQQSALLISGPATLSFRWSFYNGTFNGVAQVGWK